MRDAPEAPVAATRLAWRPILHFLAPTAAFLAVVVQFLRFNEYSLLLPESLMLLGATVLAGVAAGSLAYLLPSILGLIVIVGSVGVYLLYSEDFIDLLAPLYGMALNVLGPAAGLVVVGALLLAAVSFLVLAIRENLATIVSAIFGAILVGSIVFPTPRGGEPIHSGRMPSQLKDLPPVIHLVLDEHIGLGGLPPEIAASEAVSETLRDTYSDFALYRWAYSRFGETQYSLAGLLNAADVSAMADLLTLRDAGHDLKRNAWFDKLKAEGYAIHVYQTPWLDFCVDSTAIDACDTYPMYSPNALQRTPLSTLARFRALLAALSPTSSKPILGPLTSMEALGKLQADLKRAPRGVAYFAHLLLPHYDYLYDADCRLREPAEWGTQPTGESTVEERRMAYDLYLAQMSCTTKRVQAVLDQLKSLGVYEEATIIVHGDHGSRIGERSVHSLAATLSDRDLIDHFATFLAVKRPGAAPGIQDEPVELQRFFAANYLDQPEGDLAPLEVVVRDEATNAFLRRTLALPKDGAGAPVVSQRDQLRPTSAE